MSDERTAVVDDSKLKDMILKLLDRAGSNPRLTARLLREKAEERLKLDKDALKYKREDIKKIIAEWWNANMVSKPPVVKKETPFSTDATLQALTRLAKALGKGPVFFKKIADESTGAKIRHIRQRLREEGHKFSDEPTNEEIEKARREYELRKEKEDLDTSAIISHSRKRGNVSNGHDDGRDLKKPNGKTSSTESPGNNNGPEKPSSSITPVIQKRRVIDDDSDGEAEF